MTATVSIFDLCQQTFGEVKAAWREPLETMERTHSAADLQEAFGKAKDKGAKSLAYVETILQNKRPATVKEKLRANEANKLLCAACELPTWVDSMTVRNGFAICRSCAVKLGPGIVNDADSMTPAAKKVRDYWAERGKEPGG